MVFLFLTICFIVFAIGSCVDRQTNYISRNNNFNPDSDYENRFKTDNATEYMAEYISVLREKDLVFDIIIFFIVIIASLLCYLIYSIEKLKLLNKKTDNTNNSKTEQ